MENLTRNGVSFAFEDAGKGAPPILLIHDLGHDHRSLQPQFDHFRGRHRVISVDLLGHGQSDNLPQAYTLAAFAEDLAWLCYELGVYRPIAIGHGIGGMIAIELAGRYPDLLAAVVALGAPVLTEARPCIRKATAQLRAAKHAEANSGLEGLAKTIAVTPHLAATLENAMVRDGDAALALCNVPMLCIVAKMPRAVIDRLRKLCPLMVVESLRLGHSRQCEEARQVNVMIDAFLKRNVNW